MAKQNFETIAKKRALFSQRVITLVLIFVGIFTVTYIVGLAATRHNARALVEPTDSQSVDADAETKDGEDADESGNAQDGEQTTAAPESSNGRTIYLTFDDGPGPYTERLLDILKKHDVKATFFLTEYHS